MIVGVDAGSSAAKAVAVDADGAVAASAREPYPDVPGARGDPEAVLGCALSCVAGTVAEVGAATVEAVALSAAMHTLLVTDADGAPLGPATTWADTSASPADDPAVSAELERLYPATGCPPWPVYAPARLRRLTPVGDWRVGTLKEWIVRRLAGRWWMDILTASTTGLLDLHEERWAPAALALARIDAARLPELVPPTATAALLPAAARRSGLPAGLPVVVGAADGPLVNLAVGAAGPGEASLSIGTTAAVRAVGVAPHLDPQRRIWCYRFHPGGYLVGGAVNNGGLLLDWTRRLLYPDALARDGFARLFDEAGALAPGADGVRMRPQLVAERDPAAGGPAAAFEGLAVRHRRGALARAAVDALALSLAAIVERLEASGLALRDIAVAGLPAEYPLLARALCDCLGRPLRIVRLPDASAVGAALLAYEALGQPVPPARVGDRSVTPQPDAVAAYATLSDPRGADPARGRP